MPLKPPPFKLRPDEPNESDLTRQVREFLKYRGYFLTRNHVGKFKTPDNRWITGADPGTPDWTATHQLYPGFFLELKRPGETTSPLQQAFIERLALGYKIAVAVIDDVRALRLWLDNHERAHNSL